MPTILNKEVGPIGYGLMGLTWRAQPPSQEQAFAAMTASLKAGCNNWNGGELYGSPERNSLHLLQEYFTANPGVADKVFLSIKGGLAPGEMRPDGSEKNVRRSVDECIKVLAGTKKVDLFECARVDPNTPIETTVEALGKLVKEGKIGGIGLSEVNANTIRKAHAVHPIAAVEVELSLWSPDILSNGIAATCAELAIPIIAYSPLSRGALTGGDENKWKSNSDVPGYLKHFPKFQDDVLAQNMRCTDEVEKLAQRKGCTKGQVAISWVRQLSGRRMRDGTRLGEIFPIPGATTEERVRENAVLVELTEEEMGEMEGIVGKYRTEGARYGGHGAKLMDQ